ncbi:probable arginine--tRNA ligase, mitochondrial isoform X2 [Galleria mellonella]|uniref:Probable arginine--tRNA ligase, mitochondrial n=1 Tax=Galleria mellonella TaxID=7137 RepID=A0ABM3MKG7_GALME|nr:probable arginine--tRNA ligase, mitochondrial isoform X2 [Galleria mellonella]
MTLINKVCSMTADSAVLKNMRNLYVSYRHHENSFVLNFYNKKIQYMQDPQQNSIQERDSDVLQFSIDRATMLKYVLTHISFEKPHIESEEKHIVIDFSSPNIAKPFHVGHLRSTIIGNFIANINKFFNNKVTKINYLGDWGTQFGLLQYGLQAKNIDISKLKSNPIKCLYDTYVYANKLSATDAEVQNQARKYFSDIEQGQISLDKWKQIRELTVTELENVYQRLGIQFDDYHWESDYNGRAIKHMMDLLEQKNIIVTDDSGKKIAKVNNRNVTVLKSDNSTLYLSRDIAALLDRYRRYKFDKMLYVVDNAQTDHFAAVFEIVRQFDKECTEGCQHIKFGRIKGMSTRSGNVVFLNDILDEAKRKMYEKQQLSKNIIPKHLKTKLCIPVFRPQNNKIHNFGINNKYKKFCYERKDL